MLLLNQVFRVSGNLMRLLWQDGDLAFWIDIENANAWPLSINVSELELKLLDDELELEDDPFSEIRSRIYDESSIHWQKCQHAWGIIKYEIDNPELFYRNQRGKIVKQLSEQHKVTHQSIIRYLRRFWQRGMCMQALLPDYINSGGKGKRRDTSKSKLGRKRSVSSGTGINITPEIERIFRLTIEKKLLKPNAPSIPAAYSSSLNLIRASVSRDADCLPTITQFRYFIQREYAKTLQIESQLTDIEFEKDARPLKSTSTSETLGPGFRYQIDATIADIYLLSAFDRTKIVGRPVIYFVIDVYSRMVTGMYIGFENPSWISAMMAMINAACSKVEYCKQFGIEIDEQDWPVFGLPDKLLADQGEFKGTRVEPFIRSSGSAIENAKARRGDAKGIVERTFRAIQCDFKPFTAGIVEPVISKKRGGKDYRLDATLSIYEFTQKVIELVLYHNKNKVISKYDRSEGIPSSVPSNPLDLWKWGIANLTGKLKTVNEATLKVNLLPHAQATTSDYGVCLFGAYYTCPEIIKLGWLHRSAGIRPNKVTVAYDTRNANQIYIRPDNNMEHYWICELTDRSRRFRNMTFWDLWQLRKAENKTHYDEAIPSSVARGKVIEKMERIEQEALSKKPKLSGVSKSSQVANIRENKQQERAKERQQLTTKTTTHQSQPAKVIPFSGEQDEDYSYPDYVDDLFDDEDN